jgi:hypothetical protein
MKAQKLKLVLDIRGDMRTAHQERTERRARQLGIDARERERESERKNERESIHSNDTRSRVKSRESESAGEPALAAWRRKRSEDEWVRVGIVRAARQHTGCSIRLASVRCRIPWRVG